MSTQVKSSDEKSIIGRLGGDPERKVNTEKHFDFHKFSLAVNSDGKTKWVDVIVNGRLQETAKGLKKGDLVVIKGVEKTKTDDKKSYTSFVASEIQRKEQDLFKGNLFEAPVLKNEKDLTILEMTLVSNTGDQKEYNKVSFFSEKAQNIADLNLAKGDFISVVGYKNSKTVPGRTADEKPKTFEWINGSDLKVLSRAKDRASEKENSLSR